jgi:hypothetical protein
LSRLNEPERGQELKALLDKARADIVAQAKVTDPDLTLNLDLDDKRAAVSADYSVEVTHPIVHRTTMLHFHKVESADITKVKWE